MLGAYSSGSGNEMISEKISGRSVRWLDYERLSHADFRPGNLECFLTVQCVVASRLVSPRSVFSHPVSSDLV